MTEWVPVPEPIVWTLPKPQMSGGLQYTTLTVGAPAPDPLERWRAARRKAVLAEAAAEALAAKAAAALAAATAPAS